MRDPCADNHADTAWKTVKTDARDALMIAQCLSYGGYHAVYIPTQEAARAISFSPLKLLYILNNFLVFDAVN